MRTHHVTCDDDVELLAALASSRDAGFEPLVRAYQRRVYGLALRLSASPQDAEEIAQDTFVRAYRALAGYGNDQIRALALRAWLYRIALNVFHNRVRVRRVPTSPLELDDGDGPALRIEDGDPRAHPEQMLIASEAERELAALVATLPRHLRVGLVLRHVEGLGYAEIATLLDAPVGTVKAHVHRGAKLLRTSLEAHNREEAQREEAKVEALR